MGGAVCDLGAEWVASFQPHILALLKELDIQIFDTYTTGKATYFYKDTVARYDGSIPPLPVEDLAELAAALVALDVMAALVPADAPWTAPEAAAWDAQTIADWLDANIDFSGAGAALDLIVGGVLSAPPHDVSLLHYLFLVATTGGVERFPPSRTASSNAASWAAAGSSSST